MHISLSMARTEEKETIECNQTSVCGRLENAEEEFINHLLDITLWSEEFTQNSCILWLMKHAQGPISVK